MADDTKQATPRVGDEVIFRAFTGCTIAKVFDDGSVEVHVPYFGCEMAAKGEWQLKPQAKAKASASKSPAPKTMSSAEMRELAMGAGKESDQDRQAMRDEADKAMEAILAENTSDVDDNAFAHTWLSQKQRRLRRNHEVFLHVYDLDQVTAKLNDLALRNIGLGAYHCGIEVLGDEWFFVWGDSSSSSGTGVLYMEPKSHQVHVYKESVSLGHSPLTEDDVRNAIADAMDAWSADSYHIVNRNCVHFSEDLASRLQVPKPFPAWVRGALDAGQHPLVQPLADWGWRMMKGYAEPTPEPAPRDDQITLGGCFCAPGKR